MLCAPGLAVPYVFPKRLRVEWIELFNTAPKEGPGIRGAAFYDTPFETWWRLGYPKDGTFVLDVGCGHGRMAVPLLEQTADYHYLGVDILPKMIGWNRHVFAPWPRVQFALLDIINPSYRAPGKTPPEEAVLPCATGSVDIVLAVSLFTHIERIGAARRYLQEMARCLRRGGRLLSSWYLFPPTPISSKAEKTVFTEPEVYNALRDCGFRPMGDAGALTRKRGDQLDMIAVRE